MTRRYQTNFTAHDMDLLRGTQVEADAQPAAKETPKVEERSTEAPDGTSAEVLAWVDGDAERAMTAYDKEMESDDPRVTLISKLEGIVDAG